MPVTQQRLEELEEWLCDERELEQIGAAELCLVFAAITVAMNTQDDKPARDYWRQLFETSMEAYDKRGQS